MQRELEEIQTKDSGSTEKGPWVSHSRVDEEIELIDYLRLLWKRRKLIVLGTVSFMLLAGAASLLLPRVYEATAQIRIGRVWDKQIEDPYLASELVQSDAFMAKVIERLQLSTTPYRMKKEKVIEARVFEGGTSSQKLPLLLSIQTHATNPEKTLDLANTVIQILIEEHQRRFDEKLKEYQAYEKELAQDMIRMDSQIIELEKMIKIQTNNPTVNAPSIILLQAQLEQKSAQLINFKKELRDTRINNVSSIVTETTRLIAPPVLPNDHISPRVKLNMAITGILALFLTLLLSFFFEYLERIRMRERNLSAHYGKDI